MTYLRFASVYKGFSGALDFEREAGLLTKDTAPKSTPRQPGVKGLAAGGSVAASGPPATQPEREEDARCELVCSQAAVTARASTRSSAPSSAGAR